MRAEYDAWAIYYDWLHQGLPGETSFYLVQALSGQGLVLELGTGTGRIAIPLAQAGAQVIGLDLSANMLAVCAAKRQLAGPFRGSLTLVQADIRCFGFACRFEHILMPYRTFMHLLTRADQLACLREVRRHLAPGGKFILNLWAAQPAQLRKLLRPYPGRFKLVGKHAVPEEELDLWHYYRAWYLDRQCLLEEEHRIQERQEGRVVRTSLLRMRRACFSLQRMRSLFAAAGLQPIASYGGFEEEPLEANSREMIFVLTAPK